MPIIAVNPTQWQIHHRPNKMRYTEQRIQQMTKHKYSTQITHYITFHLELIHKSRNAKYMNIRSVETFDFRLIGHPWHFLACLAMLHNFSTCSEHFLTAEGKFHRRKNRRNAMCDAACHVSNQSRAQCRLAERLCSSAWMPSQQWNVQGRLMTSLRTTVNPPNPQSLARCQNRQTRAAIGWCHGACVLCSVDIERQPAFCYFNDLRRRKPSLKLQCLSLTSARNTVLKQLQL